MLPRNAVRHARLAFKLMKVGAVPLVVAHERILVGVARFEVKQALGLSIDTKLSVDAVSYTHG